jgi:plasmid stabilization system protein ParE
MDFEVAWTEPAVADLEAAVKHVAEQSLEAAEDLRVELLESVEVLARFPFIGPAYERDRTGRSREILCRRYRIFYRVQESQRRVEILTVWHGSRREPRLPGSA